MRKRANPEHRFQVQVRQFLLWALPGDVEWTASLTGVPLSMKSRVKAKAAGVRRGWPDISLLCPDGITRFLELKSSVGSLSPEQRVFRDRCAPHGIFAVCRTLDEVEAALRGWGLKLRARDRRGAFSGVKALILGPYGIGKTSLLRTLDPKTTLFVDGEAGDLAVQDVPVDTLRPQTWPECRHLAAFIGGPNPALPENASYSQAAL
jgi:hypothetical protein